jgi:hypothetical protein
MGWFTRDKGPASPSLDEQLDTLASCGVKLAEGVDRGDVVGDRSLSEFEADPFRRAIVQMGQPRRSAGPPGCSGFISDDVWHFDAECIEGPGAYESIAARLAALAQGDLPLQAIEDRRGHREGEAWLQFTLDGQMHRWEASVEGGWVDPTILGRFAALLAERTAADDGSRTSALAVDKLASSAARRPSNSSTARRPASR